MIRVIFYKGWKICILDNIIILYILDNIIEFSKQNFFNARNCFSKIFISVIDVKMKLRIKMKNMQFIQRYGFLKNRFYLIWSSQRPPASVGVKNLKFTFKFAPQGCMRSFAVGAAFGLSFSELVARRRVVGRLPGVHASRAALFTDWHVLEKKFL